MGSGQSSSVPTVPHSIIVVTSSDDLNDQLPSIDPETHITVERSTSEIIQESSDNVIIIPDGITATLDALNLSNEAISSSSAIEEVQSPPTEEQIGAHQLLSDSLVSLSRDINQGTAVMEDVVNDGNRVFDSGMKSPSSCGFVGNDNEYGLNEQRVLTKPDIGYIPISGAVIDRPHCTSESDIIESNSGVSPVSSSSVSFNVKVDTTGLHEKGLNSEYNITATMQKSLPSDHAIVSSSNLNAAADINARLDTRVEVRVYPCSNSAGNGANKKFTQFTIKPEVCSCLSVKLAPFHVSND